MSLPDWLQELKDAEAKVNEKREGSRWPDLIAFEAAIADAGSRLIRIAEAAEKIAKDHPSPMMRAALRGDEKGGEELPRVEEPTITRDAQGKIIAVSLP